MEGKRKHLAAEVDQGMVDCLTELLDGDRLDFDGLLLLDNDLQLDGGFAHGSVRPYMQCHGSIRSPRAARR